MHDADVVALRGPKQHVVPERAYATAWESEADGLGGVASTGVVFITNRECPFRCVMCDLWTHTLDEDTPAGAVPSQVRAALAALPPSQWIKLYNAGSFFDPRAIPPADQLETAALVARFERVVVEAHPAFLRGVHAERCLRVRDRLQGRLEVAIGLETANPDVLARLNKRMTVDDVHRAADFLAAEGIDLRVFVLLNPPFLAPDHAVEDACRSLDAARAMGARVCTVIPTRAGNGAVDALRPVAVPRLADLHAVIAHGLSRPGMVVLPDLWDADRWVRCPCDAECLQWLSRVGQSQRLMPWTRGACDHHV